ncbi:MAG: hypothetical protein ACJA1A_002620 [Saprospiraceae bacterium]|jgi:hypothetical protein
MIKATVTPVSTTKIHRLQDSWSIDDFKTIIDLLGGEFDDLDPAEIEEYMEMMISDNDVPDSAYEILKYVLGESLNEGQLRNLSNEMEDDKMWEEHPDMAYHKDIFRVNQMLYRAYNGKVPKGEAHVIEMKVKTTDADFLKLLVDKDADAVFRLVMGGSDSHSKVHRLYDGEEASHYIDDANHILWYIKAHKESEQEVIIKVTSSAYWLDSYQDENQYTVNIDMDIYKQEEHV